MSATDRPERLLDPVTEIEGVTLGVDSIVGFVPQQQMILQADSELPQPLAWIGPSFCEASKRCAAGVADPDRQFEGHLDVPLVEDFVLHRGGCPRRTDDRSQREDTQLPGHGPDLVGQVTQADLDASVTVKGQVVCPAGILAVLVVEDEGAAGGPFATSPRGVAATVGRLP